MHRSETEYLACAECGAEISVGRDRSYQVGVDTVLCFGCALRRGGSYDEQQDRWRNPPDTSGIAVPEE